MKLIIFRGETQVQEYELKEQTVRIGRGTQNDIVLEDPGKGVSRHHAEIRFERGRYTLVDLQSQNGIWVSGTRVPSVVLEPGITAALGPFRVTMQAPAPVSAVVTVPATAADPVTELTHLSSRTAAPLNLDSLSAPAEKVPAPKPAAEKMPPAKAAEKPSVAKPVLDKADAAPTKPAPVQKPTPAPAAKTAAAKPAAEQKTSSANPRVLAGVAVLLVIGLSALVGYKMMRNGTSPAWDPSAAQQLIASGKCQEALDTQITPALQKNPSDARALMLRDQCNKPAEPAAPTTTIPAAAPVASVADRLTEAEALLVNNVVADCQTALDTANAVLTEDPNNERAKGLSAKATACVNPPATTKPPAVATAEKPATPISPAQGGLEVTQGETEKAYKARVAAMSKKYDDAVAVLAGQKYQQALALFNEIVPEVPSGYRELAQKREEARAGIRAEAKSAYDTGQAAENRGDLDAALEQYRRARQLDPNPQYDAALQRTNERKLEAVRKRCNEAIVNVAYGSATTSDLAALQDAARVLPASDACSIKAKDLLKRVK